MDILAHPWIKIILACVIGLWAGFDHAFQALLILMCIDIASGTYKAWKLKQLSSSCSYEGLVRKVYILLLIGAVEVVDRYGQEVFGLSVPASEVVAGWFAVRELISIVENSAEVGVNLPPWLKDALAKLDGAPSPGGSQ